MSTQPGLWTRRPARDLADFFQGQLSAARTPLPVQACRQLLERDALTAAVDIDAGQHFVFHFNGPRSAGIARSGDFSGSCSVYGLPVRPSVPQIEGWSTLSALLEFGNDPICDGLQSRPVPLFLNASQASRCSRGRQDLERVPACRASSQVGAACRAWRRARYCPESGLVV